MKHSLTELIMAVTIILLLVAALAAQDNSSRRVPDFAWDDANKKLKTRSILVAELADPSEIALRRTGPDNAPNGTPAMPLAPGRVTIGLVYAQAMGTNGDFEGERQNGTSCLGRSAEIALQADGTQTADSRPGRVVLATTPEGSCESIPRLAVEKDGTLNLSGVPSYRAPPNLGADIVLQVIVWDGVRERIGYIPIVIPAATR